MGVLQERENGIFVGRGEQYSFLIEMCTVHRPMKYSRDTVSNKFCFFLSSSLLTHHHCRIGKILIQTNWDSGEPELYYLRLPKDIKDYQVCLSALEYSL